MLDHEISCRIPSFSKAPEGKIVVNFVSGKKIYKKCALDFAELRVLSLINSIFASLFLLVKNRKQNTTIAKLKSYFLLMC